MLAEAANFGERFGQPCGVVCRERGEWRERGSGGFIGAALVVIQGVGNARGSNSGDVTGRGREGGVMMVMTGGAHLSARRGVSWVPVRVLLEWAAGSFLLWAESVPRGPIDFYFFFLLFYFLFSFSNF
jgi:hypothetical protein